MFGMYYLCMVSCMANSVDTDQTAPTAPLGVDRSGFTLFATPSASFGLITL